MSKLLTISVPDGKRAEWINGVLTLIDEPKVDNRPVTERIKTFKDACNELGEENVLVQAYRTADFNTSGNQNDVSDVFAYLKLRIIAAALNEGWEPKFEEDKYRYFPWFKLYTKEQYEELDDEEKGRVVYRGNSYAYAYGGVSCAFAYNDASYSIANIGSRLAFRTYELAVYAGKQFLDEWANFVF